MRADPVCMPRNTARYIACPILRIPSCSDQRTASDCERLLSPRCTWNASSGRCELKRPRDLCPSY